MDAWRYGIYLLVFTFDISLVRCAHSFDIDVNTRRQIPYLRATMYYSLGSMCRLYFELSFDCRTSYIRSCRMQVTDGLNVSSWLKVGPRMYRLVKSS